jgi:hypothetical protein
MRGLDTVDSTNALSVCVARDCEPAAPDSVGATCCTSAAGCQLNAVSSCATAWQRICVLSQFCRVNATVPGYTVYRHSNERRFEQPSLIAPPEHMSQSRALLAYVFNTWWLQHSSAHGFVRFDLYVATLLSDDRNLGLHAFWSRHIGNSMLQCIDSR